MEIKSYQILTLTFDSSLFLKLVAAFIMTTVAGTVTHECGHWLLAKMMGCNTHISYAMTWQTDEDCNMSYAQQGWVVAGGPLQTMLTGTAGLFFLRRALQKNKLLNFKKWCLVFLSLFWLRQTTNFFMWVADYLIAGRLTYRADEIRLAQGLELPFLSIMAFTGIIGAAALWYIIFRVIPKPKRLTFILGGIAGGVSGFLLWLVYFGKYIMP